jgi:TRAP-type uncharacterized transport system fused permease subunit
MPGSLFQESELFNLAFALLSICFLYGLRLFRLQVPRFMVAGFAAIVAAYVFTVVEGVWLKETFNFLEHLSYMVAGVCFFLACRDLARGGGPSPTER